MCQRAVRGVTRVKLTRGKARDARSENAHLVFFFFLMANFCQSVTVLMTWRQTTKWPLKNLEIATTVNFQS